MLKKNIETDELLNFIDESPTSFHAVHNTKEILKKAEFTELARDQKWVLELGKSYYVIHEDSSILAFTIPLNPSNPKLNIVGAHTDSPNLRIKPQGQINCYGYTQTGVEVYGGVLINSWVDRDLSIAGKIYYKEKDELLSRLINIKKPIARIPQLAIHINREVNEKGLGFNNEKHLVPILGQTEEDNPTNLLEQLIANELKINTDQIISHDLSFYTCQKSTYAGINDEFIFAPRLDNLAMCHAATYAITNSENKQNINFMALFDHEEIGSRSATGADSIIMKNTLKRIFETLNKTDEEMQIAISNSLFLSADMAHAIHPNFPEKSSEQRPFFNKGPVIKINKNQKYATDAFTEALFREICQKVSVPVQTFFCRTDMPCGSTIGPMSAAHLGIKCIDIGNPMLSMHSSREMGGSQDHPMIIKAFQQFYQS